jgi:Family of unknown function (DUF6204)
MSRRKLVRMSSQRVLRVIVRGRFYQLSEYAAEYLRSNQSDHDVSSSAFTAEGVLTYDSLIDFFSIRYEIRVGENDSEVLAAQYASSEAELVLNTMGFGYRNLRTTVSDMADVWGQRGANDAAMSLPS